MNKKDVFIITIALIISSAIFFVSYNKVSNPKELYRVYLKGETIGYIKDKALLEKYIDDEQYELKEKYNVDKVYLPNDLDIVREITYNKEVTSEEDIYNKIKDISPFTINGYTITIKGVQVQYEDSEAPFMLPDKKIYVIDKDIFDQSIKNTVHVFISETDYNNFINNTQPENKDEIVLTEGVKERATVIEDIYIENPITITEGKISAEEKIFTDPEELNKYMLFGTTEDQAKYTVQIGDSISNIAFDNQLSVAEFLIANPEFTSENNLLSEGQVVNLGLINPLFRLVEEDHVEELQRQSYETKIEYDENMIVGYEKVTQEGEDGVLKVTKKVQKVNGEIESAVISKTDVIKAMVPKIIVKGSKVIPSVGNVGIWAWPTQQPSCITSPFGWRSGKFHSGADIACTGCGSPVYAANNGNVEVAQWHSYNGYYIIINHNNGYYSYYGHLSRIDVEVGQIVQMGEQIGAVGATGAATGCHVHFMISAGFPYRGDYTFYNPLNFY